MENSASDLLSFNQNLTSNIHIKTDPIPGIYVKLEDEMNQKIVKWFECSVEVYDKKYIFFINL
jgi:hypothetical protein